jgi:hypothetical protein
MTTWIEGRVYNYYGAPIVCMRRYFEGALELVDLVYQEPLAAGEVVRSPAFNVRTASALAPCVVPRVTETLGGVMHPVACDHHQGVSGEPARVRANAGPFNGRECCQLCGSAVDATAGELVALYGEHAAEEFAFWIGLRSRKRAPSARQEPGQSDAHGGGGGGDPNG